MTIEVNLITRNLLGLKEQAIQCPYCGEGISILVDCSVENQSYIEDCEICCRPISIWINIDSNQEIGITVRHENE